jgi:hypothetical protein
VGRARLLASGPSSQPCLGTPSAAVEPSLGAARPAPSLGPVEPIPTFWTERTGTAEVSLRIFTFGRASNNQHDTDQPCPAHPALEVSNGHTYQQGHDASAVVFIEYPMVLDADRPGAIGSIDATSEEWRSHPLWPASCALCGLEFGADYGQRQVNQEPYYAAADGRKWLQRDLPPGAQYAADWLPDSWKRDGFGLAVIVPGGPDGTGHQWLPDAPAANGDPNDHGWTRTGDPKLGRVDANPSILVHGEPGWHGYLRHGSLIEA